MQNLNRYTPYALAALRIIAAPLFIEHGTQKLFGFPAPPEGGLPPILSIFGIGAILELGGGLLILAGLLTRPVAFILAGEMAVAYWRFHAPANFYPALNGGDAAIAGAPSSALWNHRVMPSPLSACKPGSRVTTPIIFGCTAIWLSALLEHGAEIKGNQML